MSTLHSMLIVNDKLYLAGTTKLKSGASDMWEMSLDDIEFKIIDSMVLLLMYNPKTKEITKLASVVEQSWLT